MAEENQNNTINSNTLTELEPQIASLSLQEKSTEEDVIERLRNIGLNSERGIDVQFGRNSDQPLERTRNLTIEDSALKNFHLKRVRRTPSDSRRCILSMNEFDDLPRFFGIKRPLTKHRKDFLFGRLMNIQDFNRELKSEMHQHQERFRRQYFTQQRERRSELINIRRGSAYERFRNRFLELDHSESDDSDQKLSDFLFDSFFDSGEKKTVEN
ncbi:UNVERIFIED_CONTAM: hypothetical protein RMT77_005815 [Armadillidium vulgare]